MDGNGVAALRVWPITVDLRGMVCRLVPHPAIRWIVPILDEDWAAIVPGMIDPEDQRVDDALDSGTITYADCIDAAHDAVGVAAGMQWWAAVRLVHAVVDAPNVMGEMVLRGVDAQVVSLGAFVQAAYRIFTRDADKKQVSWVDSQLTRPPVTEGSRRYDPNVASDLFEQMAKSRGIPT